MSRISRSYFVVMFFGTVLHVSSASGQNVMSKAPQARTVNNVNTTATTPQLFSNLSSVAGQSTAAALQRSYQSNTSRPSSLGSRSAAQIGRSTSLPSKPFSSYTSQPTVSPYLNLFRVDLNGNNDFNYSTLVRPQLQQQQLNQQLERQNLQNARRLQSIAAQPDFNPQGSKDSYPTGHQTVFNYMGHYYPVTRPAK